MYTHLEGNSQNESILSCQNKNLRECEEELFQTLQEGITKILTIKTLLPRNEYNKLKICQNIINTLVHSSAMRSVEKTKVIKRTLKYSCPESYNGSVFGYPYFTKGFVRSKCERPSLQQSTSLIIEDPNIQTEALQSMLKYASVTFHQIFLLIDQSFKPMLTNAMSRFPHTNIQLFFTGERQGNQIGHTLNIVLQRVKSEFVIIAPRLGKLDNTTDIERLINVQEITGAHIVGSAMKNIENGDWDRGCYQSEIKMYILKYFSGYYTSKHECLYCKHIVSPFIAKTKFLIKISFGNLNAGVYRDLFLRIGEHQSIVSCPDVLFYIKPKRETDKELVPFAVKWEITKIIEDGRVVRWFGNKNGFEHTSKRSCKLKRTLAVPPDCRANLLDIILFTFKMCEEYKIRCELQEGTLIGAVKFNNILPWERDADITVLSEHFNKLKSLGHIFQANGYGMHMVSPSRCCFEGVVTGGVLNIFGRGWTVEVYGQHKLTSPNISRTRVLMGNQWVYTPENPGLYVRNRYGKEIYKHAEHWMPTGKDSGWALYNSGSFSKCETKGHHSCLEQFKGDGNIQFQPWL